MADIRRNVSVNTGIRKDGAGGRLPKGTDFKGTVRDILPSYYGKGKKK